MTLQTVSIIRMTAGLTASVAISYGFAWPLSFIAPIFTTIFLFIPVWIGWKKAVILLILLGIGLLVGLIISEFFLDFPLLCVPLYALLFFVIYYHDTPSAPPMAALFITIGITMVPIMGLSESIMSHIIATALMINMGAGLFIAFLFHTLIPNTLASQAVHAPAKSETEPPPLPSKSERARLAMVSTIVALSAVIIFFSLNLGSYAFAMLQICLMAGAPSANASFQAMKGNAIACLIGGIAIIIAYNLMIAVPTYDFLIIITLCWTLLFSIQIYRGGPMAKAYLSGLTTFLVLLGTSTMVEAEASSNFYIRIAQILFAGLFAVAGLIVVEYLLRPRQRRQRHALKPKKKPMGA